MAYVKVSAPAIVYHLTKKANVPAILREKKIRRFDDRECWFCRTPEDMRRYMEYTVLNEGGIYIDNRGKVTTYPKFVPDDYALLVITPKNQEDKWWQWNQELPRGVDIPSLVRAADFSRLKVGYRGDLKCKDISVCSVTALLKHE